MSENTNNDNGTSGIQQYYKPREWINVSTLTATARCPRKAFYSSGCELQTPGDKPALEFGTAIHKAVPELLSGDRKTSLERALRAFSGAWNPLLDDDKRNAQRAKMMLFDFAGAHAGKNGLYDLIHPRDLPFNAQTSVDVSDRVSEYELPFIIDIGLPVPLVGRIDGIGRLRDTGEYCLVEYKTASSTWGSYFDAFQLSPQILTYNVGARASLPGLKITKCVVEVLEVSKTKTSTTAMPVSILDHHVESNLRWAQFWGGFYLECERTGNFPQWFTGCHPYSMFGSSGYVCDYQSLCMVSDWTKMVSLYRKVEDKRYEIIFPDGKRQVASGT